MSLVQAAHDAESSAAFEHIPIMWVRSLLGCLVASPLTPFINRDLAGVDSSDPTVRRALGDQVRDACMNVGFLYGVLFHGPFRQQSWADSAIKSEESWNT